MILEKQSTRSFYWKSLIWKVRIKWLGLENQKKSFLIMFLKRVEITEHQLPKSVIDICAEDQELLWWNTFMEALKRKSGCNRRGFQYLGPKPQTKESEVINIVDSRSCNSSDERAYFRKKVQNLVHSIIMNRLEDGQFVEWYYDERVVHYRGQHCGSLNGTFHCE